MHHFIEKSERLLSALILVAFGGAVAGGLFEFLNWSSILAAILIIFFVRPVSGLVGLIPFKQMPWRERFAISFFGIRGIGSIYYLAFALNKQYFPNEEEIWALTGLVIVLSLFVHGIFATPVTRKLDQLRKGK